MSDIAIIEALRYLTHWLNSDAIDTIAGFRRAIGSLPRQRVGQIRSDVRRDIASMKRATGCRLTDAQVLAVAGAIKSAGQGYIGVHKRSINEWFRDYSASFPRWPHIPLHACVIFGIDLSKPSRPATYIAEAEIFSDVTLMWSRAQEIAGDGETFLTRDREKQRDLQSYLRLAVSAMYQCLEAYLNGVAYDCFQTYHAKLKPEEHDLLAEWNSKEKRRRFVAFEKKVTEYPRICAGQLGLTMNLKDDPDVQLLVREGKVLRDSLTHQSPYPDPEGRDLTKLTKIMGISLEAVKMILHSGVAYMLKVEKGLGHDPVRSAPWLRPFV